MIQMYLILFFIGISAALGQRSEERLLRAFFKDVVRKELSNNELINKYLCKNSPEDKAKMDEIISIQLEGLRKELVSVKVRDISFKKYSELTPAEQDRYLGNDLQKSNMIVAYHKNKKISQYLVVNNKVASMGAMNKGGTYVFLKLCRD